MTPANSPKSNRLKRSRGRPALDKVADIESTLLDVALQEFLQHGYGGASVTQIVKKAQMSKTTVYSRFASKADLFHAIIEKQIEQLEPAKVLASTAGQLDLEQGLKAYANHMLDLSLRGELLGVNRLMYSESHRFPELAAAAAKRTHLGIKRIAEFIRDCAAADGIACHNAEAAAEVFILMVRGWYIDVMLTNQNITTRQRKAWVDKSVHVLLSSRDQW